MFAQIEEKWTNFKKNIDTTNEILAFLDYPLTSVSVSNETPVMKEYKIEHYVDGIHCARTIKFNGSIVNVDQIYNFDMDGYTAWKWGWVRNSLDKNIKKQEKAQKRLEKSQRTPDLRTRIRCAAMDIVLGRGTRA